MKFLIAIIAILSTMSVLSGCAFETNCGENISNISITDNTEFETPPETAPKTEKPEYALLECRYYSELTFNRAVYEAEIYDAGGDIFCGVVPHHLLADKMIAGFFKSTSENRPDIETVVIVSTMHYEIKTGLATTFSGWAAPQGTLTCDTELSQRFYTELGAKRDDELLQLDHSSSSIIPFVKYYYPNASVSCLLVSHEADTNTPQNIAKLLSDYAKEKEILVVFSVDFSHYQTPSETDRRDAETLDAVTNGDLERISRMNDANVDSPYCLSSFVILTELLGGKPAMLGHSNSLKMTGIYSYDDSFADMLTSYYVFAGVT